MLWFLGNFLHFFFGGHPWYQGAVWGNVVAIIPCGIIGWLWSKTKFWPLNHLKRQEIENWFCSIHGRIDILHNNHFEIQAKLEDLQQKHEELKEIHEVHLLHLENQGRLIESLHEKIEKMN